MLFMSYNANWKYLDSNGGLPMSEVIQNNVGGTGGVKDEPNSQKNEFSLFRGLNAFEKAVEGEASVTFDFDSVIELSNDFLESTDNYMILNIKDTLAEEPNNLLFLTEDKAFLYAKQLPPLERGKPYQAILAKPFGASTVLTFIVLTKVFNSYKQRLESLINEIKGLEQKFDLNKYHDLSLEFERLHDRLEEYGDLVLRLQERCYTQVETEYISFDYRVLIAESNSLQGRYRRRLSMLRDLRQDFETEATTELNHRIARLNDVVKKLTAITVILMIPTLIASHFGMNFALMPELQVPWAYPTVIGVQVALMGAGLYLFHRIGWL
jgi:Mg2+ and Co2+ transporter CorA